MEEFNKLNLNRIVDEFLGRFEDLNAQTILRIPVLTKARFLSNFVGALKEEIKFAMKMFKPTTFKGVIEKARMHKNAIEVVQRRHKPIKKPHLMVNQSTNSRANVNSTSRNSPFNTILEVCEYRNSKRLYFLCGDKFFPSHQCLRKQLNCLKGESEPSPLALGETMNNPIRVEANTKISELPADMVIEGDIEQQ